MEGWHLLGLMEKLCRERMKHGGLSSELVDERVEWISIGIIRIIHLTPTYLTDEGWTCNQSHRENKNNETL